MQDPHPENITGEKKHVFEHRIDWSWVLAAVAAVYITWQVAQFIGEASDDGNVQEDDERHPEVIGS